MALEERWNLVKEALIMGVPVWKIKGDVSRVEKCFRTLSREVLKRIDKKKGSS